MKRRNQSDSNPYNIQIIFKIFFAYIGVVKIKDSIPRISNLMGNTNKLNLS